MRVLFVLRMAISTALEIARRWPDFCVEFLFLVVFVAFLLFSFLTRGYATLVIKKNKKPE